MTAFQTGSNDSTGTFLRSILGGNQFEVIGDDESDHSAPNRQSYHPPEFGDTYA